MDPRTRNRRIAEGLFMAVALVAVVLPLGLLAVLVGDVVIDAWPRLELGFLTGFMSRHPERAGIWPAIAGSLFLIVLTVLLALPLGVAAAVYLEEYGKRSRLATIIEINIANLAGVPSVIYGLLGLGLFVRMAGMGRSLFAGASTMALLVLPIVIMASREALRTVPSTYREASLALGATRWQTIRRVVLPVAAPGILTGLILATSRALGETAPLIVIGAITYITFAPATPADPFTVLPIQIFSWLSRPQRGFVTNAAAGIVVLLVVTLLLNAVAIVLRHRLERRSV